MSILRPALIACSAALALGVASPAFSADKVVYFPLAQAVKDATAEGKLDGSVKFYLAGSGPSGRIVKSGAVTNKKSNAFAKSDEKACLWTAQSALIQLQQAAKDAGANAVTGITSYYKKKVYKNPKNFECHVGAIMAGVALRGNLAIVK